MTVGEGAVGASAGASRAQAKLAWGLWGFGVVTLVGSFGFGLSVGRALAWADLAQSLAFLAIGTAGLAIARHQPGNAVGWVYLGVWASVGTAFALLDAYVYWATVVHPGVSGGSLALWLNNWIWVPIFGTLLTFPFLLFPDGHLPSPRWRPVAWAAVLITALWSVAFALEDAQYTDALNRKVANPYAIASMTPFFNVAVTIVAVAFIAVMGASIASLVVRFRRSRGDERQQIKWLMLAGAAFLVWIALPLNRGNGGVVDAIQGVFLALIPAAVAIAILKFRLYDVDVVIKKTVVFTLVAGVLLALYLGVIALATVGAVSRVLVGVVLLAVTFSPVRRAARSLADRIVYGKRATSYEVLADFSERMAETYATDDVLPRMAQILAGATGASAATVWLRIGGELRPSEISGEPAAQPEAVPLLGDVLPPLPDDLAVEVRHQGELLGALSVRMPANDPLDPGRERLVRDLASQAGLVLRNVRLIEELKASRQRLVAAQDEERRKLERNLHDGAQQQLVALSVKARLAQQLAQRDPARVEQMLEQIRADTNEALENLRDLARGIYPPLLRDKGLVAALEAQARRAVVPTTVEGDGIGRFGQDVEAAVYFSCLEALQNIAKYAAASRATIALSNGDGSLRFTVTDNGVGFDSSATSYGTGLQGIADRLAALGGELEVRSELGRGTRVEGQLPAASQAVGEGIR